MNGGGLRKDGTEPATGAGRVPFGQADRRGRVADLADRRLPTVAPGEAASPVRD